MIDHRHVIFVLAVVKVAKRDVTAVRSLIFLMSMVHTFDDLHDVAAAFDELHTHERRVSAVEQGCVHFKLT